MPLPISSTIGAPLAGICTVGPARAGRGAAAGAGPGSAAGERGGSAAWVGATNGNETIVRTRPIRGNGCITDLETRIANSIVVADLPFPRNTVTVSSEWFRCPANGFGSNRLTSLSRVKVPVPVPSGESAAAWSFPEPARGRRLSDNLPISVARAMTSLCFGVTSKVAVWASIASPPLVSSFWSMAMTRTSCSTVSAALCWASPPASFVVSVCSTRMSTRSPGKMKPEMPEVAVTGTDTARMPGCSTAARNP